MRWDEPLDPGMTDESVREVLNVEPFASMDATAFSPGIPLEGILKNDCRLLDLSRGDIIVREGDYGNSAFLIVFGEALVSLKSLPASLLGRRSKSQGNWTSIFRQFLPGPQHPEVRDYRQEENNGQTGNRDNESGTRVFLHDIPRVIPVNDSVVLGQGEIFGELSALTRTPRSATVVANSDMRILEIRWQGLRELMKRNSKMHEHMIELYRQNSLHTHLRETEILKSLPQQAIDELAAKTQFESFGSFQWNQKFESTRKKDVAERILSEPLIAEQGTYVDGLIMIRNGFARLSRKHGDGHQTIAYLGKGQIFGLRELAHNWRTGSQHPWSLSLRALGYVDILRISTQDVEKLILPNIPEEDLPPLFPQADQYGRKQRQTQREEAMDGGLLEFLVEKRYINGTKAMMIDLDRCTRCDDCVRACASTHDNNPRFNRQGEIHDKWMITQACMHCLDPVCMIGCPTGAIGRDAETGNVSINDSTCIGCSTCANSCPYNNIQMVEINDPRGLPIVDTNTGERIQKATKCDFCEDQLGGPACQRACPHDALVRIDLSTPQELTRWSKR